MMTPEQEAAYIIHCEENEGFYYDELGRLHGFKGDRYSDEWKGYVTTGLVDSLDLSEEEGAKSLYSCTADRNMVETEGEREFWVAYVVRTIKVKKLLESSSSLQELELEKVGCESRILLSVSPGCGVFKSRIIFAGGKLLYSPKYNGNQAYVFDNQISIGKKIRLEKRMTLEEYSSRCSCPVMGELGDKLYAFFYNDESEEFCMGSVYHKRKWHSVESSPHPYPGARLIAFPCYAVVGTKLLLFLSFEPKHPDFGARVLLFDSESKINPWKKLCLPPYGFLLPMDFQGKALVVNHHDINILFFFDVHQRRIGVYTMSSLDDVKEDGEFLKLIGYFKLPPMPEMPDMDYMPEELLPYRFPKPISGHFVHIGGTKVCFVGSQTATTYPLFFAIPFQFDIDTTQEKKHFTLTFMPPRISLYLEETRAITDAGCFVL